MRNAAGPQWGEVWSCLGGHGASLRARDRFLKKRKYAGHGFWPGRRGAEIGDFRRSGFGVEEARSRIGFGRGRAMLGMPFGPGTAHVGKLGAVGVDERLEQAPEVGKFSGRHATGS